MTDDPHVESTNHSGSGEHVEEYAKTICEGLNRFIEHSQLTLEHSIQPVGDGEIRISFAPKIDAGGAGDVHEYTVEDCGEVLTFRFDGQELAILSDVDDWSVFDRELHTGEAISCIIETTGGVDLAE